MKLDLRLGMCFMAKQCDIHKHVTCHRYKAELVSNELQVIPISQDRGHYKVYSSMYDGVKADTYL